MDTPSVETFCTLLDRSRLIAAEEVSTLRARWLKEAGATGADGPGFCRWLVKSLLSLSK